MTRVQIVPGRSIGGIGVGAGVETLPPSARQNERSGQWDGVHFMIADGKIADVWIDDLRALPGGVEIEGVVLARDASLDELKRALGPCEKTEGVKGGVFFHCGRGLVLGCDYEEKGTFIQIRLQ